MHVLTLFRRVVFVVRRFLTSLKAGKFCKHPAAFNGAGRHVAVFASSVLSLPGSPSIPRTDSTHPPPGSDWLLDAWGDTDIMKWVERKHKQTKKVGHVMGGCAFGDEGRSTVETLPFGGGETSLSACIVRPPAGWELWNTAELPSSATPSPAHRCELTVTRHRHILSHFPLVASPTATKNQYCVHYSSVLKQPLNTAIFGILIKTGC